MQYKQTQELSDRQFKRLVGVKRETFDEMVKVARQQAHPKKKQGCPTKLSLEDRVLVSLQYWREYRTYFHMAQDWGVSESTICRIVHHVETTLIRSDKFRLAGKNSLLRGFERPETVVLDVMESPIERPQQGQKQFYSGKKGRHSLKSQIVIALSSREIYCTAYGKGKEHDFHLFQVSGVHFHPDTQSLEDKGYRGIAKFHANSQMQIQPYRGQSQRSPNPGFGSNRRCHTVPSMPQS